MTGPKSCWICGAEATTREHRTKRSDLKSLLGERTQAAPFMLHSDTSKNRIVGSLNADKLKWSTPICADCNNRRTQPFDLAWEQLSSALRGHRPNLRSGMVVRTNRIFRTSTRNSLLMVHLFFAKQFGCYIADAGAPIPLVTFSEAILNRKAHPNLYLIFKVTDSDPRILASGSHLHLDMVAETKEPRFAAWVYQVGRLEVMVMYAAEGEMRDGLVGAWHPRLGTTKLIID